MLPLPNALIETWFSTGDTASLHLYSKSSSLLTLLEAHPGFSPSLMYSQPSLSPGVVPQSYNDLKSQHLSFSLFLSICPTPHLFLSAPTLSPLFFLILKMAPLTLFWIQSMTQQLLPVAKSRRLSFSLHRLLGNMSHH